MQDNRTQVKDCESDALKMSASSPIRTNFYELQVEDHQAELHEMAKDNQGTGILEDSLSRQQERHKSRKYPFSLPIRSSNHQDRYDNSMSHNLGVSNRSLKNLLDGKSSSSSSSTFPVLTPAKKQSYIKAERNSRKEAQLNLRRDKVRTEQYLADYNAHYTLDDQELERDYYLEIQQGTPSITTTSSRVKKENVQGQANLHEFEKYQFELEDFLRDEQEDLNLQIQNLSI